MHPQTEPKKLTPDVGIPVRPPRTGVNTASGVRGPGVEEVAVLKIRTESPPARVAQAADYCRPTSLRLRSKVRSLQAKWPHDHTRRVPEWNMPRASLGDLSFDFRRCMALALAQAHARSHVPPHAPALAQACARAHARRHGHCRRVLGPCVGRSYGHARRGGGAIAERWA